MLPHPVHRDILPVSHRAISPRTDERVNAETFYDGLIMGLRDYVSRAGVFKIRVQTPSEHLRLRDPSAPFRHARNERSLRTYVSTSFFSLFLLSVSLSGSLAFLCSRGETEWPGEEHEYEPSQMNRARACAPSLILSHDRNLFAYDLLYFFPLGRPQER